MLCLSPPVGNSISALSLIQVGWLIIWWGNPLWRLLVTAGFLLRSTCWASGGVMKDHWRYLYLQSVNVLPLLDNYRGQRVAVVSAQCMNPWCTLYVAARAVLQHLRVGFHSSAKTERVARDPPVNVNVGLFTLGDLFTVVTTSKSCTLIL